MKYLYRRPNGYYYLRLRVPVDLYPIFGKKFIKNTLKIKKVVNKKHLLSIMSIEVNKYLQSLRCGMIDRNRAKYEWKNLIVNILQNDDNGQVEGIEVTKTRYGKVENSYKIPINGLPASAIPVPKTPLSEVIAEYCNEKIKGGNWTPKTQIEFKSYLNVLVEIVGDIDVKNISYQIMRDYKNALGRLPANRKKSPQYRYKTVKEILAMPEDEVKPMHLKTANKNLSLASGMMGWAIKQGYLDKNYADGLSFPVKTRAFEEKSPYSIDDIAKIIVLINGCDRQARPERYWIPLIAMFSGMRMGEVCQLQKEDINEVNGVWSMEISYKHGKKNIKTKSSERTVPIHRHLITLGLLDFVNNSKTGHLWTNLKYDEKHGYSHKFQRWFGDLNREEVTDDPKKTFHCLRKNFTDYLKQSGVAGEIIEELLGHELKSQSTGRYAKPYRPDVLKPILDTVDYGVNLPVKFYSKR